MQERDGQQEAQMLEQQSQTVGQRLRMAREARGLTVESVARTLRLNARYLEALEADKYDAFPAQPYVRVYIKTVSRHLGVDPHEVLNLYRRQSGVEEPDENEPGRTRVDLETVNRPGQKTSWPTVIIAVAILIGIAMLVQRTNRAPQPQSEPVVTEPVPPVDSATTPADSAAPLSADTTATQPLAPVDTSIPTKGATPAAAPVQPASPALPPMPSSRTQVVPPGDSLVLVVSARKDSGWAQVFADGSGWTNFVKPGKPRVFRARDSLNISVGYNANMIYELNGVPVTPSTLKGVAMFRIGRDSIAEWNSATWRKAFRNRADGTE
jgi:cytoskeleton protein RodZ